MSEQTDRKAVNQPTSDGPAKTKSNRAARGNSDQGSSPPAPMRQGQGAPTAAKGIRIVPPRTALGNTAVAHDPVVPQGVPGSMVRIPGQGQVRRTGPPSGALPGLRSTGLRPKTGPIPSQMANPRSGALRRPLGTATPFGGVAVVSRPPNVPLRVPGDEIRVGVVEPETLMRTMMVEAIDRTPGMRVALAAGSSAQARQKLRTGWMDVLVIEVDLVDGNGVTLALETQRADPQLSVVTVTRHDVRAVIETTERHLRRPWLHVSKLSTSGSTELVAAIRQAANGPDNLTSRRSVDPASNPFASLTAQQLAVLRLISEGFTNAQVAEKLGLSRRTVENHLLSIYRAFAISADEINPRVSAVLRFLTHSIRY